MNITNYISDLLYRYECVIIPDFGGFISNAKSAYLNTQNNTFYPPYKALTFNANLVQNDGLLANYIAKAEGFSYDQALVVIKETVAIWQGDLKNKSTVELDKIGSFNLNPQGQIVFEPQLNTNYLTTSYGLSSLIASQILSAKAQPVIKLNNQPKVFLKYAAVFVIGLSIIGVSNKYYQDYQLVKQNEKAQAQQLAVQNRIQAATFVISNPLPSITLQNTYEPKNFHVVAGAFRNPANAVKKLNELKNQGFNDAAIIGLNQWQLTQVVYGSFALKEEAQALLNKIRRTDTEGVWLLIQNQ
ncbi:MAG: hypothetical protein CO023_01790 [Flavobacteriales bacterium CG_4_9_14_0_2_um_filter_35_242]|nr:SPOR domain-containing protein [Zetaproteobacteria bacterium]NDK17784.1 SPOR domain-containing protein [Flavobacteriales bacterium]OIO11834.1 MAG: hypothetical protein AUJ53_03560 [Flavobacteriaceae bacterium CG1_02_35_72]PIV16316.1 MAG: hypothetical protein COS42_10645 [Flavobacteriales bacterium CG03_land_8_20_14_0_80_35_15]PIX06354.1 MAG: hypothetical protein COZ76_09310 [Flavobacteriales bacterium CG_4_8_14_3_um_filter_35_10]PJA04994.1 MAG: hypothetical protein COX71_09000 [Flavobacteri